MAAKSYDEAFQILSSAPVVSSNYFILAGADGQGAEGLQDAAGFDSRAE